MLISLDIKDFAIIEHLIIQFHNGFSVVTGETGAGKSIIMGALGMVMGQRADSKSVRNGAKKCVVEATFDIKEYELQDFFSAKDLDYEDICTIRREINDAGKSRAFINDTPVNLNDLKDIKTVEDLIKLAGDNIND